MKNLRTLDEQFLMNWMVAYTAENQITSPFTMEQCEQVICTSQKPALAAIFN